MSPRGPVRNSLLPSQTSLFVVVVVVETVVRAGILSHRMLSLSELGEHRNDPSQHCLTLCVSSSSLSFAGLATVLNRCAFRRRATSDLEEAAPIGIGPLTVAFGDVQRDRLRGTQQLVPCGPIAALQALGHWVCPSHIPDRNPVDIALLHGRIALLFRLRQRQRLYSLCNLFLIRHLPESWAPPPPETDFWP